MLAAARAGGYNAITKMRKACDAFYNSGVEPKTPRSTRPSTRSIT